MKKGINFKMKMEYCRGYSSAFIIEDVLDTCIMSNDEFHNITVPSEDIWKKFELLPTPPRSPTRDSGPEDDDPKERLRVVTNLLDDTVDSFHLSFGLSEVYSGLLPAQAGLKNDLLHDCMWSGMCTKMCKKNVINSTTSESADACDANNLLEVRSRTPTPSCGGVANSDQCVDPSFVLPYTPLSDHSYHQATQLATHALRRSETEAIQTPAVTIPERLGSDTPSDSDDEDEIDVVTIQQPSLKRKRKCPFLSLRLKPQCRPKKRHGNTVTCSGKKRVREDKATARNLCRYSSSSRSSSDSEDCVGKRSQHNSMERKRRDDLRYAFQTLRENVPDLKDKPKAPKIVILNQAATYVHQLTTTGQNLDRTLKQETKRRHELQRRLLQLQRTKF